MLVYIKILLSLLVHIPHVILYHYSSNKVLIDEDVRVMSGHVLYRYKLSFFCKLILLLRDPFFKTLFYHRIGSSKRIISFLNGGG